MPVKRSTPPFDEDDLNAAERELIRCAAAGEIARVKHYEDRTVRAALVRELAIESWDGWPVHEQGVLLIGAEIQDTLDLVHCHVRKPLALVDCDIGDDVSLAIDMDRARLGFVSLYQSRIRGGIRAQQAKVQGDWFMRGAKVSGGFDINGATVDGQVSAEDAAFSVESGDAINAHSMACRGWFMDRAKVHGCFRIMGAKVDGQVSAEGATFFVESDDAINAHSLACRGWFMDGAEVSGAFTINSAKIDGQVNAEDATFSVESGDAINAHSMACRGWFMDRAKVHGRFWIASAKVDGQVVANEATFSVESGHAINAQAMKCEGWFMRGATCHGVTFLHSATVGAGFVMDNATLQSCPGESRALDLTRARIDGFIRFFGEAAIEGALVLDHARVEGEAVLCPISPTGGRSNRLALSARHLTISRLVMPREGMAGVVDLRDARIGTLVDHCDGWPRPVERGLTPLGNRMLLDGLIYDRIDDLRGGSSNDNRSVVEDRIRWLLSQPREDIVDHFKPQPWQQLAKVMRAAGYIDEAREVEIEARNRYRWSKGAKWPDKLFGFLAYHLSHYGRSPVVSLSWSLGIVLACTLIFHNVAQPQQQWDPRAADTFAPDVEVFSPIYTGTANKGAYPEFNALAYSLDVFVPILDLGMEEFWRPNTAHWSGSFPTGWALFGVTVIERVMGAVLVALTIIGLTGLLRRGERPF